MDGGFVDLAARSWECHGGDTLVLFVRGKSRNDARQSLYVGLVDQTGKGGFVISSDPSLLTAVVWNEWRIPLSQFGVNAAAVKKLIIGIGNRAHPVPGGAGLIYVDTIQVIRSATP